MSNQVEKTISDLKNRYHVETDSDLAKILGVDKSTISSWKMRNKIPARITEIIKSDMVAVQTPPVEWGPFQKNAFGLALLRFSRVFNDQFELNDFQQSVNFASKSGAFFLIMGRAEGAILNMQDTGSFSYETATAMVIHEDLADPQAAIARDSAILREYGILKV